MFYGWFIVFLLFLSSALGGAIIWHSFTTFFDPLIAEFGWSYTAISLVASLRGVEVGLADIFVGFMIDRLGGRRIILAGTLMIGIGYLLLSRVNSLAMFFLLFLVVFVGGSGLSNVVFFTVVSNWFRRRTGLALGITAAGYGAGGLAVPGVVRLLDAVGFRTTFLIFGVTAILVGALIACFMRSRPEDIGASPDGVPAEGDKNPKHSANIDKTPAESYTLKQVIHTRTFWIILYIGGSMSFATSIVSTHVMPYLQNVGYARYTASLVAMMIPVMSMVGRISFGGLSDVVRLRAILVLVIIAELTGIVLFYFAYLPPSLLLFLLFFGTGTGGMTVLRAILLKNYFGGRYLGSIMGLCFGLANFGVVCGPALAGRIFDVTGSYSYAWVMAVSVLTLGLLLVPLLGRPQARPATITAATKAV